jgi:GNAT superfamily N-acetyltransferase
MQLRSFQTTDTDVLVKIYRDTVRRIGPDFYTASQVEAWAIYPEDVDDFAHRLSRGHTLVAEKDGIVHAFAQLDPIDFVSFIYTSADVSRCGVGTRLLDALEAYAFSRGVTTIRTEASRIAKAFFHKRGYQLENLLHLTHFGVEFEWYCMAKTQTWTWPEI